MARHKLTGPGPGRPKGSMNKETYKGRALMGLARVMDEQGTETGRSLLDDWMYGYVTTAAKKPDSWQSRHLADILVGPKSLEELDAWRGRALKEDADFVLYRIHRQAFDIQQEILLSRVPLKLLMAGRRAGKTTTFQAVTATHLAQGHRVLYIGKTITTAISQMYEPVMAQLRDLGVEIEEHHRNEGVIRTRDGAEFQLRGNSSTEEREKLRGEKWHCVIIDECQSQTALSYLREDIIEPMLVDYSGELYMGGTGPRVRGTYWEMVWSEDAHARRWNWSLQGNPFIPDHLEVLAQIRADKGLTESDPLYVREYLGKIAYDDDALVLRLGAANYYDMAELEAWVKSQPPSDIRLTAGLDFGFADADAFVIIAYSISRPERYVVWQYKARRTGLTELVDAIRTGMTSTTNLPALRNVPNKQINIFADTAGKKMTVELYTQYNLPVYDAYKANKDMGIELLQAEVRTGAFKLAKGSDLDEECMRTVFARDELDNLTREIDDTTYHPDVMDAVLYSLRGVWMTQKPTEETK